MNIAIGRSLLIGALLFQGSSLSGDEAARDEVKDESNYVKWTYPVATAGSTDALTKRLNKLADVWKCKVTPQTDSSSNPGCCMWVDLESIKGKDGYIIVIHREGSLLLASDLKQLDNAIERLERVRRVSDDVVSLPLGILTNVRVVSPDLSKMK